MTREQKLIVRENFAALQETAGPLSLLFYGRLFSLAPEARRMLHGDIKLQGKKLMDMLQAIVDSLDSWDRMRPILADLGARHAGYGVTDWHYEMLASALLWSFGQALEADFDARARAAWTEVVNAISLEMRSGAARTSSTATESGSSA
jgi:hemoglobin-like flavoprotein